jgi:hypothetical protein
VPPLCSLCLRGEFTRQTLTQRHRGRTEIFKNGLPLARLPDYPFSNAAFVLTELRRGQATLPNPETPILESAVPQSRREVVATTLFLKCDAGKVYGTGYKWASQN